jgi:membrane protein implicated in regulation of membrane protease activity
MLRQIFDTIWIAAAIIAAVGGLILLIACVAYLLAPWAPLAFIPTAFVMIISITLARGLRRKRDARR